MRSFLIDALKDFNWFFDAGLFDLFPHSLVFALKCPVQLIDIFFKMHLKNRPLSSSRSFCHILSFISASMSHFDLFQFKNLTFSIKH